MEVLYWFLRIRCRPTLPSALGRVSGQHPERSPELLVEGTYSNHALFLTEDEDLTGAGIAVADDNAGCWAASTSHRRASSAPATARTSSSADGRTRWLMFQLQLLVSGRGRGRDHVVPAASAGVQRHNGLFVQVFLRWCMRRRELPCMTH